MSYQFDKNRDVAQSHMRLFECANSPHAAFFFLCSGGQKRLFESPSDALEQKKGYSRVQLLRNISNECIFDLEVYLNIVGLTSSYCRISFIFAFVFTSKL
jgi:hypothetical protein